MSRPLMFPSKQASDLAERMAAAGSMSKPQLRAIASRKRASRTDSTVAAFLNTYKGVLLVALFLCLYTWVSTDEYNTRQFEQATFAIPR